MLTSAVRFVPLFTDADTTAVPLPVPDAPLVTVSQVGSLLVAVHEHQLPVVTVTDVDPPPAASAADPGEIAYVHGAGACVTVNVWPAIVAVAERGPVLLAATFSVTEPLPVPEPPPAMATHAGAELVAVHAHQLLVATATPTLPPAAENDWLAGVIV
jgi:hypothetical protein